MLLSIVICECAILKIFRLMIGINMLFYTTSKDLKIEFIDLQNISDYIGYFKDDQTQSKAVAVIYNSKREKIGLLGEYGDIGFTDENSFSFKKWLKLK